MSFFREPHRRIISLYSFWRALHSDELQKNEPHIGVLAARNRTLLQFLDSPEPEVRDFIDNVYVRRLTGVYASHAASEANEPDLDSVSDAATDAFTSIDFIGLTEDMGQSLQMLATWISGAPPTIVFHENALATLVLGVSGAYKKMPRLAITTRERASLDRLCRLDGKIYALAKNRFEMQRVKLYSS